MASVGKEVILKNTSGQLVQKESSDHVVTVTKKDTLDEDSFTEVSNLCRFFRGFGVVLAFSDPGVILCYQVTDHLKADCQES